MEYIKKVIYLLITVIVTTSSTLSQGYLSRYVPLEFLPNTRNFDYIDGRYIVSSINFIEGVSASTIIEINGEFDTIKTTNNIGFGFGRFSPFKYENIYYGYGADWTNVERHILIQMDEDFQEIKRDSFYPENRSFNANGMTMIGDKIVGSSWDYIECPEQNDGKCEYMNYKIIDTEGNELNSIDVGREHPYFFSFEVDHTDAGNIICGGNRQGGGTRATVYNFDLEGNTNWSYESPDKQSRNNVPVYVEELSNGNIVFTDKLDKSWDDEYLSNLWTNRPSQLVWLSSDGERLFSYIDTLHWQASSEFKGLLKGKGDYFFVCGEEFIPSTISTEFNGAYGSLMKWSNDGELIWKRLYRHSQEDASPIINRIIEHDNGDISTLGSEVSEAGYFMWMTRLNEFGCLDNVDCDMPMVLPTVDISPENGGEKLIFYPNPSSDLLNIRSETIPESIEILALDGTKVLNVYNSSEIQIGHLPQGLYILRVKFKADMVSRSFMKI